MSIADGDKTILKALAGETCHPAPVWLMRQAGRYLPEYRELRARTESFLDLCFTPKLAAEATLQPIRRFGMDAAILFSDILVVPYALGQSVSFETSEGPQLAPAIGTGDLRGLKDKIDLGMLAPVFDTIALVRAKLSKTVALLGFCGAPWTVASYMVAGHGTSDQAPARLLAYRDPVAFARLIDLLVEASIDYLVGQFRAGVDAVQLFDTWAGVLGPLEFAQWCIEPAARIVAGVRGAVPRAKIIGFPRGAGTLLGHFMDAVAVSALGLDWAIDRDFARKEIQSRCPVQGNLDPVALVVGGAALDREVDAVLAAFAERPFIFNLGHGILPQTPVAHVEGMLARIRGSRV